MKLVRLLTLGWLCAVACGVVYEGLTMVFTTRYVECQTNWADDSKTVGLGCTTDTKGQRCVAEVGPGLYEEGTSEEQVVYANYLRGRVCYCLPDSKKPKKPGNGI